MPFTFSHPAAVLPFRKLFTKHLSFAGLVIGSIIPDFEYFIRMKSKYSHTLDGMFWFDLPMAVVVAFVFFNIVRNDLIDNMPYFLRSRLTDLRNFDWNVYFVNNWLKVLVSMLIGIGTHILWDGFTHRTGWFVQHISALNTMIDVYGARIVTYRLLQHLSTITGGVAVLLFIYFQPVKAVGGRVNYLYWLVVGVVTLLCVYVGFQQSIGYKAIWTTVIILIASLLAGLIVAPVVMLIMRRLRWK